MNPSPMTPAERELTNDACDAILRECDVGEVVDGFRFSPKIDIDVGRRVVRETWRQARAGYAAPPREPTEAMTTAGFASWMDTVGNDAVPGAQTVTQIYQAMYDAAPTLPVALPRDLQIAAVIAEYARPGTTIEVVRPVAQPVARPELTFAAFRVANVVRCLKWHPAGIESWSPSDWLTAVTGELGELASLLKMRNRERDGLPGNKFSPSAKQVADEIADVLTYLDLLAAALGVDLGCAAASKFNEVSERVGFPDRLPVSREGLGDG